MCSLCVIKACSVGSVLAYGVCIRDDEGRYVLAKTEWMTPLLDVELGEAVGTLSAMHLVRDL